MLALIGTAAIAASLTVPPNPLPPVELYRSISANPAAGLLQDAAGNFYGTTKFGGDFYAGSVFKLAPDGTYSNVYEFTGGSDGWGPASDLISDASGNLYGTAIDGGTPPSYGVVFKVAPDGTETVLHNFSSGTDGSAPYAGVVMDARGNLYGTTYYGGGSCIYNSGCGTVFKLAPDGAETILHRFTCGDDGCGPYAGLILDKKGNLYGTNAQVDASLGNVFEITTSGTFKVLHKFAGSGDGADPLGRFVKDAGGNLYGTTATGGANGYGTVFMLTPAGSETILHSFTQTDGAYPDAGLIRDRKGNLYGTTQSGGRGCGTVFRLSPAGQETILHSFYPNQYVDGCQPVGDLLMTKNGNLYGTTYAGGTGDTGTVFVITP